MTQEQQAVEIFIALAITLAPITIVITYVLIEEVLDALRGN